MIMILLIFLIGFLVGFFISSVFYQFNIKDIIQEAIKGELYEEQVQKKGKD